MWQRSSRIRNTRLVLTLAVAVLLTACDWPFGPVVGNGDADEAYLQGRRLDYLRYATETQDTTNPLAAIAHLERNVIDPPYVPGFAFPPDAWASSFAKMTAFEDTSDFGALYLANLLFGYRDHPLFPAAQAARIEDALLGWKYWYDEPTPQGIIDNNYYWSENHQLIFHTLELLMGQAHPDAVFRNDGKTGRAHYDHARPLILAWLDLRARFGFTEWHSDVYYQKDVTPLLTLVEFAEDEEIRTRAAMVLDLTLFDIASHSIRGNFGATHGRSYKKDKTKAIDQDTFGLAKFLFDDTSEGWTSRGDAGAVLLARAKNYRMPEAILRIAKSRETSIDRQRMSLPLDERAPITPNPVPPFGLAYDDVGVWFGMAALTAWQVVPLTLATFDRYDLWETEHFREFVGLRDIVNGNVPFAQVIALGLSRMISFGQLSEVNTYTYRTPDFMLSTAQDYRAGSRGSQYHAWQATLDERAIVFTTHPGLPPVSTTAWGEDNEPGPGYWTGEASMPRSAQHENVAIHVYAPQYVPQGGPVRALSRYEPFTHAFFPQDRFDEVVQDGHWVFGRRGDGYVALYSWRMPAFVDYAGRGWSTDGMIEPFDLRAEGGPDNVWIVECARAGDWTHDFAAFRSAVAARVPEVTSLGAPSANTASAGFSVRWESPSQGEIRFGWSEPLRVRGTEIAIRDYPRFDNPWVRQAYGERRLFLMSEPSLANGYGLHLDFERGERRSFGPANAQP